MDIDDIRNDIFKQIEYVTHKIKDVKTEKDLIDIVKELEHIRWQRSRESDADIFDLIIYEEYVRIHLKAIQIKEKKDKAVYVLDILAVLFLIIGFIMPFFIMPSYPTEDRLTAPDWVIVIHLIPWILFLIYFGLRNKYLR